MNDGPSSYWRSVRPPGPRVTDWAGFNNATAEHRGDPRRRRRDPVTPNTASTFDGTGHRLRGVATRSEAAPNTFTAEAWFKTTTTRGGKILGFGNRTTGNSGSYDRHVYMANNGQLYFGVYPGGVRTLTTLDRGYNDGQWHHVVASLGANGMRLYVDGVQVGPVRYDHGPVLQGRLADRWRQQRVLAEPLDQRDYFAGTIDDVAVYPRVPLGRQVPNHYDGATTGNARRPPPSPSTPRARRSPSTVPRPPTVTAPSPRTPGTSATAAPAPARRRATPTRRPVTIRSGSP